MQPEMEELRTAFSKLKKLYLCGLFVDFDILWTTAFLVAAPSIERLCIEVWEHACDVGDTFRDGAFGDRVTPQWEMRFDGSENRLLKVLDFCGFRSLEQQFTFIRSVLERSPNLHKIVLRGDAECDDCNALDEPLGPSKFPRKKNDQQMVVKRIRGGIFSPNIIFDEDWSLKI